MSRYKMDDCTIVNTGKRYNLKALFKGGKLDRLIVGDFGPVDEKPTTKVDHISPVDSLIAWDVDPEMTGPHGIASILGLPVTDRFWDTRDFDRG